MGTDPSFGALDAAGRPEQVVLGRKNEEHLDAQRQ